jgi:pilus assembly protein CpaE
MQRKALIVAGAAGPEEEAAGLLSRFGFSTVDRSAAVERALDLLGAAHYDLVVLPVHELSAEQLASLERVLRQERFTFVIGTAPQPDPNVILRAMRSGVHEFLVSPPDPKELAAAVDRLMRRVQQDVRRGQVFAVHSGKGGLGTTSLAVNLAYGLAKNHRNARVALADLVVTGGDVRVFLNLSSAYHMGDLAQKIDRVDAELLNSILTPAGAGVWALPGPDSPEADELLDANVVTRIIEALRTHYAFAVLDCEHHMSERTVAAMDAADRIIIVTQLTVPGIRSAQRTVTVCRRLGYPDEKLCVVVSRHQPSDILSLSDAAQALNTEIFWKLPNDYRPSAEALMRGVPVAEVDPASKLAWSYAQLAAKIGGTSEDVAAGRNGHKTPESSSIRRLFGMKRR